MVTAVNTPTILALEILAKMVVSAVLEDMVMPVFVPLEREAIIVRLIRTMSAIHLHA